MPTTIGGTDTFPANFDIPSGGDLRNASGVNPALEALANRTTHSKNRIGAYRMVDYDDSISSNGGATLGSTSDAAYGTDPIELGSVVVASGDFVKVGVDVHVAIGLSASTGEIKLYYVIGVDPPVDLLGAVNELATAFSTIKLARVAGVAHPASSGTMRVFLDMKVAGGQTMLIEQPICCTIEAMRANT